MTAFGLTPDSLPYKGKVPSSGTPGTPGRNAYTVTTAVFAQPAVNSNVTVDVESSDWIAPQQIIFVDAGGYYEAISFPSSTQVVLKNLGYSTNALPTVNIPSGGAVSPGGLEGPAGPTGPSGAGGIVFGGRETMLSNFYLGLGGRTGGTAAAVPGLLFHAATELSQIDFGVATANGNLGAITATAYVSTDNGASYAAIPGAVASIAASGRAGSASFTPYTVPALGRVVILCDVGSFAFDVSVTLS